MIVILIFTLTITIASSLLPKDDDGPNEEIKRIISKYVDKIPDLPPRYVINEGLTNMISKYYKGKLNTFPLFKITFNVDRNPVKIPWTLGSPAYLNYTKSNKKYTYVKVENPNKHEKSSGDKEKGTHENKQ